MKFNESVGKMLNQNSTSKKYAVLYITCEQGGEAFLSSVTEDELKNLMGRFNSFSRDFNGGISLYNDGGYEDDDDEYGHSTAVILDQNGLESVRKAIQGAVPLNLGDGEIMNLLSKD